MSNADCYTLETPENIEVEFELAGLGSRFCAMFIDTLLIALVAFILSMALLALGFAFASPAFDGRSGHWIEWLRAGLWLMAAAIVFDGYFIFFEWAMRGQTPGKRTMKVRVICDDGTPTTISEVLVRNILRLVDFLPAGYALGAAAIFVSPLCKRLGDLAAGTIVVKEGLADYRSKADRKPALSEVAVAVPNAELTPEERRVLAGFLQRRGELLSQAREALAERLARPLYEKYGGNYGDAEGYVERLVEGRHYEP
jgi:uncharacterized RDD family membrane protein YckC